VSGGKQRVVKDKGEKGWGLLDIMGYGRRKFGSTHKGQGRPHSLPGSKVHMGGGRGLFFLGELPRRGSQGTETFREDASVHHKLRTGLRPIYRTWMQTQVTMLRNGCEA
jgi:hypothetical protein